MRHKNIRLVLLVLSFLLIMPYVSAGMGLAVDRKTQVNLSKIIGSEAEHAANAWMLNEEVCALCLQPPEDESMEVLLIQMKDVAVLSRHPVPGATYLEGYGWDGDTFYMEFMAWDAENEDAPPKRIRVSVATDYVVSVREVSRSSITMPDGQTIIREADDGSLYADNLLTKESNLLLQGVRAPYTADLQEVPYELFLQYEASPDEVGYDGTDMEGNPLPFALPIDEQTFRDNDIWFWRNYHAVKALDDSRFVYTVSGWEWGAGFGIYDLKTHTNYRMTGRGYYYGMVGSTLYGSSLAVDSETYQAKPLPPTVQAQLEKVSALMDEVTVYDISPDGKMMAFLEDVSEDAEYKLMTILDAQTGNTLWVEEVLEGFSGSFNIQFYGNARLMIYARAEDEPAQLMLVDFKK